MNERQELSAKLVRLHNLLGDVERDKKIIMADYKERISDIKDEMKAVVDKLNELDAPPDVNG